MNNSAQTNDASAFAKTSTDLHLISAKSLGEDGCCVRQNRVVLASVADATPCGDASAQPGAGTSSIREATVTKRIRRRGERGISRKAIAQGMPECSSCTCMLVCALLCIHCTRDRGCSKHPAFPAPSVLRDKVHANLGQIVPREREVMSVGCLKIEARYFHPVVPDKRSAIRDP